MSKIRSQLTTVLPHQAPDWKFKSPTLWKGRVEKFLLAAPKSVRFDLIVSSPPYNIGKEYEDDKELATYLVAQSKIITSLVSRLKKNGSICWQVGSYVKGGAILPLDLIFHPIFDRLGMKLRNRIVWHFGHGQHAKRRFSGRYEVVLWYTKSNEYCFNLDAVRVPSKYPGKKAYRGARRGEYSSNPLGKNPEDVWALPNVKGNHIEKTSHPCQYPVGLIERLILALTKKNDLVFDPFAGVGSAGVAAVVHGRKFVGCEKEARYIKIAKTRLDRAIKGQEAYRPHDKPIYDHTKSPLSQSPTDRLTGSTYENGQPVVPARNKHEHIIL